MLIYLLLFVILLMGASWSGFRFLRPRLGRGWALTIVTLVGGTATLGLTCFGLLALGVFDPLLRPAAPAALQGQWECVNLTVDCSADTSIPVGGDLTWHLGPTFTFTSQGEFTLSDGYVTSGHLTCQYDGLEGQRLFINCALGGMVVNYTLTGDRLTLRFADHPPIELQRVK